MYQVVSCGLWAPADAARASEVTKASGCFMAGEGWRRIANMTSSMACVRPAGELSTEGKFPVSNKDSGQSPGGSAA